MNLANTSPDADVESVSDRAELRETAPGWHKRLGLIFGLIALAWILVMYWVPQYRGDEYISVVLRTQLSWPELFNAINTDPALGPFYVLLKPWSMVSTETWWMRLPIVFSMAATVGVLVGMVRRQVGYREAVFAGLSMLALPAVSLWGTDVRPYAFSTLATVVAVSFWWRSMDDPRRRWSVGYGLAVAAMGLFHLYTLAALPALLVTVLFLDSSGRVETLLRTTVPAVLGVLLITPHIFLNLRFPTGSASNPPVEISIIRALVRETVGPTWMLVAVIAICLMAIIALALSPHHRPAAILALSWIVLSFLVLVAAHEVFDIPTMIKRYFVFVLPGIALLMGVGLGYISQRWMPIAVVSIIATFLLGVPTQYEFRQFDGHSVTNRIAYQLASPALAGWPIVASVPSDDTLVNAAFFPEEVLTPRDAPLEPVAVVFRKKFVPMGVTPSPYVAPGSEWKTIIVCPVSPTREFLIVANPVGVEEIGDPNALLTKLNNPEQFKKKKCRLADKPKKRSQQ